MDKEMWDDYIKKAVKPLRCVCGQNYNEKYDRYRSGFIKQDGLIIWCCCQKCADRGLNRVM